MLAVVHVAHVIVDQLPAAKAAAHVLVDNFPPERIAATALTIAEWALGVAVVTFAAVGVQIFIAGRELAQLLRRPKITVEFEIQELVNQPGWLASMFTITNRGDKLARDIRMEVLIEKRAFDKLASAQMLPGRTHNVLDLQGQSYNVIGSALIIGKANVLYPNGAKHEFLLPWFRLKDNVQRLMLRFRVYDENFAYPAGNYGNLLFWKGAGTVVATYDENGIGFFRRVRRSRSPASPRHSQPPRPPQPPA